MHAPSYCFVLIVSSQLSGMPMRCPGLLSPLPGGSWEVFRILLESASLIETGLLNRGAFYSSRVATLRDQNCDRRHASTWRGRGFAPGLPPFLRYGQFYLKANRRRCHRYCERARVMRTPIHRGAFGLPHSGRAVSVLGASNLAHVFNSALAEVPPRDRQPRQTHVHTVNPEAHHQKLHGPASLFRSQAAA